MDILNKIKPQVEQVEVVEMMSETTSISYENNRLKTNQIKETKGTAVRVVKDGRLGFSASSDANADEKLIRNVLESAEFGDEIPLTFPSSEPLETVNSYDEKIVNLPIDKMVEMGQVIVDTLLKDSPDLQVNVTISKTNRHFSVKNHTGLDISHKQSPFSLSVDMVRVQDDDVLMIYDMAGSTLWEEDYLKLVRKIRNLLNLAKQKNTIRSGEMPVLFSPQGALALFAPVLSALSGKSVFSGVSPMKGKIGEQLFDSKLTVIDDPTLAGRFKSTPIDDEGVATKRNVFIENGVIKGFFYDLKTACLSGVESTGNGSRDLFSSPEPTQSNFIIQSGETPLADIIKGIDEGLWVQDVLGLGQGNIVSGAFSNSLGLAYKIEKGEITGRVKDVSIAGNVYDLLPEVSAISQENDWVYQNFCLPHLLIDNMNVVAQE